MKASLILAALTAIAAAQSLDDFPRCSVNCLVRNIKSVGCSLDVKCACHAAEAMSIGISECIHVACNEYDVHVFYDAADRICKANGMAMAPSEPLHQRDSSNVEECRDTL
jgi:hypothetical protein